jgi:small-conductance mechanosensitive channel
MEFDSLISRPEPTRLRAFGRFINSVCLVLLLIVMGTVVYGLFLRAQWERSYFIAVAIAVFGVIALLLGLAQQEIAARDKATWRAMAEWQLKATYAKLAAQWAEGEKAGIPTPTVDSSAYYEQLMEVLIQDMQRTSEGAAAR